MNTFGEDLKSFLEKNPYKVADIGGIKYRYILTGESNHTTIVAFSGLEMQEMWIKYAEDLSDEYGFLITEYPRELKTNKEQAKCLHSLLKKLGIEKPVLCGASDGGVHAQFYAREYPDDISGLILMTTVSLNSEYVRKARKAAGAMSLLDFKIRHTKYEKIRKKLVGIAEGYMNDETDEEKAYGHTFFEAVTVPESYRDRYLHSMVLLKDMLGEKDFTVKDFDKLDGKVLLLHPEKDIFSKNDQEALTGLFSRPEVHTMKGGHIAFVIRSPEYIAIIREFLKRLPQTVFMHTDKGGGKNCL